MDKESKAAINRIAQQLTEIEYLEDKDLHGYEHTKWLQTTGFILGEILGPDSSIFKNFVSINYYNFEGGILFDAYELEQVMAEKRREAYIKGLEKAKAFLDSAIELIKEYGVERVRQISSSTGQLKRIIFISHGTDRQTAERISKYIDSLGLESHLVMETASKGATLTTLIPDSIRASSAMIAICTKDVARDTGGYEPSGNVINEITIGKKELNDRIIYLLEEGCELPSNLRPHRFERFKSSELEKVFPYVNRELAAFELL